MGQLYVAQVKTQDIDNDKVATLPEDKNQIRKGKVCERDLQ
jgi:hypothetical protein